MVQNAEEIQPKIIIHSPPALHFLASVNSTSSISLHMIQNIQTVPDMLAVKATVEHVVKGKPCILLS